MMFPCPRCKKRTGVPHSPRPHADGGLLRKRRCPDCGFEFETLEIQRGAVDAIVTRQFKKRFGAELDRLRKIIDDLRGH